MRGRHDDESYICVLQLVVEAKLNTHHKLFKIELSTALPTSEP